MPVPLPLSHDATDYSGDGRQRDGSAVAGWCCCAVFCRALKISAARGKMATTSVDGISLNIGWADCRLATDAEVGATA